MVLLPSLLARRERNGFHFYCEVIMGEDHCRRILAYDVDFELVRRRCEFNLGIISIGTGGEKPLCCHPLAGLGSGSLEPQREGSNHHLIFCEGGFFKDVHIHFMDHDPKWREELPEEIKVAWMFSLGKDPIHKERLEQDLPYPGVAPSIHWWLPSLPDRSVFIGGVSGYENIFR